MDWLSWSQFKLLYAATLRSDFQVKSIMKNICHLSKRQMPQCSEEAPAQRGA